MGEADNGRQVLDILAESPVDVVLMDINMPVMDGYEATAKVKELFQVTKVIALSMLNNLSVVQKMLDCGAFGYLLKTTGKEELSAAVKLEAIS